jgi:hypothetical protein
MARPHEYDFEMCKEICDQVAEGQNVIAILNSNDKYPTWTSFRRWKNTHDELSTLYVKAQQDKAEAEMFKIDEIRDMLKNKLIDPASANVLIQTSKWAASKFYPKFYGDKIDVTSDGSKVSAINYIVPSQDGNNS